MHVLTEDLCPLGSQVGVVDGRDHRDRTSTSGIVVAQVVGEELWKRWKERKGNRDHNEGMDVR